MEVDIDSVLLAETEEEEAGHPDIIRGLLGALAEDLELPLALGDFGIDPLVSDPGMDAEPEVLFGDLAPESSGILEAHPAIVFALGFRVAVLGNDFFLPLFSRIFG